MSKGLTASQLKAPESLALAGSEVLWRVVCGSLGLLVVLCLVQDQSKSNVYVLATLIHPSCFVH